MERCRMTNKSYESAEYIIEQCNLLINLPVSSLEEQKIKGLLRIVEKRKRLTIDQAMIVEKIRNYYLGDIDSTEPKEFVMKIIYIKNVSEFPVRCLSWANRENTDMFDLKLIEAAARNFADKLKVPVPLVGYVFGEDIFFELP
jgi:hypothetical protein